MTRRGGVRGSSDRVLHARRYETVARATVSCRTSASRLLSRTAVLQLEGLLASTTAQIPRFSFTERICRLWDP